MSSPSVRTEGRDGPSRDTGEAEPASQDGARPAGAVVSAAGVAVPLDQGTPWPGHVGEQPDATAWQCAGGSPWAVPDVTAARTAGLPAVPASEAAASRPEAAGSARTAHRDAPPRPPQGDRSAAGSAATEPLRGGAPWPLWAAPRPHPAAPAAAEPEPAHGYADDGVSGWDDGLIARRGAADAAARTDHRSPAGRPFADGRGTAPRRPAGSRTPAHHAQEAAARSLPEAHAAAPAREDARRHGERPSGTGPSALRTPVPGGPADHVTQAYEASRGARPDVWSEAQRQLGTPHVDDEPAPVPAPTAPRTVRRWESAPVPDPAEGPLRRRLGALRELIGLSRARVAPELLAEAAGVLDAAEARGRLSRTHTTIALAGATGSGKSSLINALAGRELSPVGTLRPTTAEPVACTWENGRDVAADDLLDRLGVPPRDRRRVRDPRLRGLVLVDLPDHDSLEPAHRAQVDRLLGLVDAVVWVVDPEKYADALLHERYLRPLAGHAEVTFVVLNQTDRLPGEATDVVLDDLRRLLDEDGMALGEHGEPGARVLATSALTGDGLAELREELGVFVASRRAPVRRLTADVDGAVDRLRPVYADPAVTGPACLTEQTREEFEDRLAEAVGATAAGQAAERAWLRQAERACGTPWSQLVRWRDARRHRKGRYGPLVGASPVPPAEETAQDVGPVGPAGESGPHVARPVLDQAVRDLAEAATAGLPAAWATTVREAARRGADGLSAALEAVLEDAHASEGAHSAAGAARPRWWSVGTAGQGLLLAVQVLGVFWLVGAVTGGYTGPTWIAAALVLGGAVGGPLFGWTCLAASRGPARARGQQEERRLRRLAAGCGRARVLEPVAAELMRYREVREQYVGAAGEG